MSKQQLSEGVTHIEDLGIHAFIDAVRRIGSMQASERLDGSTMWFGLDTDGRLFTERANSKDASRRFFASQDYPYFASNNGPRAVHAALEAKVDDIKKVLQPGDTIEIEVVYGRQPNAVSYGLDGKNFISFSRGIGETADVKADQLTGMLENQEVSAKSVVVDSPDGINLDRKTVDQTFRFVGSIKVNAEALQTVDLEKELKALEDYLDEKSGVGKLSNFELLQMSMGSIPKEEREAAKLAKGQVEAKVQHDFKLAIKRELLKHFSSKLKPALAASDLSPDEDVGIGGLILKDPQTGEQIKIIDSENFETIGQFNSAVRDQIGGTVRTVDDAASLEARGGIVGQMKIRIAELLGNKEMAMARVAKQVFADAKGDTPVETLRNVAKQLNGSDDFNGTKRKVSAIVDATMAELSKLLQDFKKHKDDTDKTYRLRLKNGKTIGLSQEVIKKTLLSFAETKRNLAELAGKVMDAKSFDQLIGVLYGRAAKQAHSTVEYDELTESLEQDLMEAHGSLSSAQYKQPQTTWALINNYIATVLMSTIIYKANDTHGIRFVRDKAHWRLSKFDPSMSQLNFWGYALWKSNTPAVAKLLASKKLAAELHRITQSVPKQWVRLLHLDYSWSNDLKIDWTDHLKTLRQLIQHSRDVGTDRVNNLILDTFRYDEMSYDEKVKLLPRLIFYVRQFIPSSPLLQRIVIIQTTLLTKGDVDSDVVITKGQDMKLLGEDGEIATGGGVGGSTAGAATASGPTMAAGAAPTANATVAQNIGSVETGIGRNRNIVKRRRNLNIKYRKFKRPTEDTQ